MEARASIPVGPPISNPLSSYWQTPKSPLANVIGPACNVTTTPYSHAIIGSGISGTMIAYNILKAQPDARIIMIEAREICSGATGRNGGHTKAASYRSYLTHVEEFGKEEALKIARLEYANIVETHRLAEELGIACENKICTTVDVIYDDETFENGKKAIEALRADARDEEKEPGEMAWYQLYEGRGICEADFHIPIGRTNGNPAVAEEEYPVGMIDYIAGRIHAYRFTTGVLKECVKMGLVLSTNTTVNAIVPNSSHADDNTAPWTLQTSHNTIQAHAVILATNGYTPYLLPSVQSAIVPMRGQITAQRPGPKSTLPSPLPNTYSFIYRDGYEYMIPHPLSDGGQHIIIGGGLGRLPKSGATEYGTVDDGSLNPTISTYLNNTLTGYFGDETWGESPSPSLSTPPRVVQEWTGIMGATTDGLPFVGAVPDMPGVWMSAGFNGHGMVLCLKSAEALASMLLGRGKPVWFPDSFVVSRERVESAKRSGFGGRRDMQSRDA
ncbi:FAD dependent oxidoreductase-like protein [Paraphoma chrysanthemicola]|uniref:FAD dependent oxidoreductase-like protein n=1 Tax=Paraphoma chrysanthemicola TaxID=798071 RepID=A0A8K0W014_9PLEO|nr:FAD dependent oxidoreductase-like protein [Paraphoma chrysanthemicola]